MRFDSYHPVINLIFFGFAITFTIWFRHPVFVAIAFLSAFIYSIKLCGLKALILNVIMTLLCAPASLWYAYYNHFGITELKQNFIGNSITFEATIYGLVIAVITVTVIMWVECIHEVMSTDKLIYLFGRISPKLSLFTSIILRTVPRIQFRAKKIDTAQMAIGRGINQGNIFQRIAHFFREISIVITWTIENFVEVSDSMRSRGYTLKGRTAFSIYRFDNRDRSLIITIFTFLTAIMMAVLLDQTNIQYNPQIIMNRITYVSYIFYFAYLSFLLTPMLLQVVGEIRFEMLRKNIRQ